MLCYNPKKCLYLNSCIIKVGQHCRVKIFLWASASSILRIQWCNISHLVTHFSTYNAPSALRPSRILFLLINLDPKIIWKNILPMPQGRCPEIYIPGVFMYPLSTLLCLLIHSLVLYMCASPQ